MGAVAFFNAQPAQALKFSPFDVQVTAEECAEINLYDYVTETMPNPTIVWSFKEVPDLISIEPREKSEEGRRTICISDTKCQKISINVRDIKISGKEVELKITITSVLNIREKGEEWPEDYPDIPTFPEEFRPYEGSRNPFLQPGEEEILYLNEYVYDPDNADNIDWTVSGDGEIWGKSYTGSYFDVTIEDVPGIARIKGKVSGEGSAVIFRAANPCGFSDITDKLSDVLLPKGFSITVNEAPVITEEFPISSTSFRMNVI